MASIADLFGRLLLDDSGFEASVVKSATKAGDKAGTAMGQRIGVGLNKSAGLAVLGGLLATTAAGLTQLDDQVKRFQADVGATDDEARSAAAATTQLYGAHRAGFDQILSTLAKLRTDQQITEVEAEKLAGAYLSFANVAGGTGAQAVSGFDDILDAFNLTADKGVGLMDALVVSNQKFGGSLQQRVADLAALAPSLQGLNLKVEDGIALENLFAASGLDAGAAQGALKKAVDGLKPGQTFDDLIRQVSSIEDPTLRAQKAMEIFGARAGIGMAQALRPGITGLDEFKVSATDAAGATEEASKKIDSSLPKQVELVFRGIQASLMELAGPAGGLLTAAGSAALLATSMRDLGVAAGLAQTGLLATIAPIAALVAPIALLVGGLLALKGAYDQQAEAGRKLDAEGRGNVLSAASGASELARQTAILNAEVAKGTITQAEADAAIQKLRDGYGAEALAAQDAATHVATLSDVQDHASGAAQQLEARTAALAAEHKTGTVATGGAAVAYSTLATNVDEARGQMGDAFDAAQKLGAELDALPRLTELEVITRLRTIAEDAGSRNVSEKTGAATDPQNSAQFLQDQQQRERDRQDEIDRKKRERDQKSEADARERAAAASRADAAAESAAQHQVSLAFDKAKDTAHAYFDAVHAGRLKEIDDIRNAARAQAQLTHDTEAARIDAAKAALFAPVTAAEEALQAKQQANQKRDLAESVRSAAAALREAQAGGGDVAGARSSLRNAQEALADFNAQVAIDTQRAAAETAAAALDVEGEANDTRLKTAQDAADKDAEIAKAAADAKLAADKKGFDDQLAVLEDALEHQKGSHAKALSKIRKLYADFGIDSKTFGANIASGLAEGLTSEIKAVETAAESLAGAVAKYIKVASPAEAGPFRTSPETMGERIAAMIGKGLTGGLDDLAGRMNIGLAPLAMQLAAPSGMSVASGSVAAPDQFMEGHFSIDLGPAFGSERHIEIVERGLMRKIRS